MYGELKILAGNGNPVIAEKIADYLGVSLGQARISRFSDGEINVEIHENVRGRDVFLVQSTCAPANDHLMELLIMVDACKRSSAGRITTVIPYYGYARQDRKVAPRAPISAKLVADLLVAAGVHRVLTMDLHAGQIHGFFDIPVDNLYAKPKLVDFLARETHGLAKVIVSPDAGGAERARSYAKSLGADLAIIDKRRSGPNVAEVMHVVGDVKDKHCIILDDMADTAGTLCNAAGALSANGAASIMACCTHPVFSGPAIERIVASKLQRMVVSDSIPLSVEAQGCDKIQVVSVSELFGEAIRAIHYQDSVSRLFV
jgi:ribose-phosphate pyrophosphokinase